MPLNHGTVYGQGHEHGESRAPGGSGRPRASYRAEAEEHEGDYRPGRQVGKGRRQAIPITFEDTSLLGPFRQTLPNLQSLRSFLPTSPPAETRQGGPDRTRNTWSRWQYADLGDGYGSQNLSLTSSPDYALRIFRHPQHNIPMDKHVKEDFPPPEEVFSIREIKRNGNTRYTSLAGVKAVHAKRGLEAGPRDAEIVLNGTVVDKGGLADEYGPVLLMLTTGSLSRTSILSLVVIPVRTGFVVREVQLGTGFEASLQCSNRAIAIGVANPEPCVHLLHPFTVDHLSSIHICLPSPPKPAKAALPVFAISGRILVYSTDEAPRSIGPDGLGSIITARSNLPNPKTRTRASTITPSAEYAQHPAISPSSASSALISSVVSLGGGVARGVWAGLKMGVQAANQARVSGMAKSAPARESILAEQDDEAGPSESRSMDESSPLEEYPADRRVGPEGANWIKIVDLGRLPPEDPPSSPYAEVPPKLSDLAQSAKRVIAHFRLPSLVGQHLFKQLPTTPAGSSGISHLSWNRDGTQLFVAPSDGRVFHILQIHPASPLDVKQEVQGEVLHLYELRRGTTGARVQEVEWDRKGRWLGVTTDKGTTHIYAIHPSGGPCGAPTHLSKKIVNPKQLYSLSQIVHPSTRIHAPSRSADTVEIKGTMDDQAVSTAFGRWRPHPLEAGTYCQDISIYRLLQEPVIDNVRLTIKAVPGPIHVPSSSGLTDMIRSSPKSGHNGIGIMVSEAVKARWRLPEVDDDLSAAEQVCVIGKSRTTTSPLAHGEIRTHSVDRQIMPPSIYLNHQVDFYSAKPIDEYSPLSILDLDARQHRLAYRTEVEARPAPKQSASFDEPLSTALRSRMESPSHGEIPGLPNGMPGSIKWKSAIPIRTVTAGIGEGLGKVRHQYAKAQATRRRRRASEIQANGLSFEEDTVLPSSLEGTENSSPASDALPVSDAGAEDGWGEGWEEEYRRAVEVEGEPDDLILGLMDEEEEERRNRLSKAEEKARAGREQRKQ